MKTFGDNIRLVQPENYRECRKIYCEDCYYWLLGLKPKDCKQRAEFEKELPQVKSRIVAFKAR